MLRDLKLAEEYFTGEVDLVEAFYRPCLKSSVRYDRSVGFFRSSVFVLIGPDIIEFAQRGGKIRLVSSPCLTDEDIDAIAAGYKQKAEIASDALNRDIDLIFNNQDIKNNTEALATLIALGALEVKIVFLPEATGEYHVKLGTFYDDTNNAVSFKGSINETWTGWHERGNHETLDVFCSWKENQRVSNNQRHFEQLWNGQNKYLEVINFPDVAMQRLKSIAKDSYQELELNELVDYFRIGKQTIDKESNDATSSKPKRAPLPHQIKAIEAWKKQGKRGVFEHATGSGKTFTALTALKEHLGKDGVALVLVPDRLLHQQWTLEIQEEIPTATILKAGDGYNSWRKPKRLNMFTQPGQGLGIRVVLATMPTARLDEFSHGICGGEHLMVVADEVHEIGSKENSKILTIEAGPRLGLSATPRRYGDPIGTQHIFEFFGDIVEPPFTLVDAIESGRLVEYEYHPEPLHLTAEESDDYEEATKEIKREFARSKRDDNGKPVPSQRLQNMLIQRARIAKKASAKVPYAVKVIEQNYTEGESWLIYCEDQDQLAEVMEALKTKGLSPCEYHTSMKGDPAASLDWFKKFGGIMVSIRCLDQGVDIPKISHAIILASSQNPRQFIQRRGRVLRACKGKYGAVIYDAVVVPLDLELEPGQLSLMKSELQRSIQFSDTAINRSGANKLIRVAIDLGIDPQEVGLVDTDGIEEVGDENGQ
ncbi:DEAD/DEAH box helicase family protein [Amphritea pacifica]|uniref:DEAD/DEAH box helicase family protein n=1 Tax=Amphritea pacifica TaxID=2811233 RepID=UPI00196330C2|nr:DEAD/DEAH box helicase family protein [Amphritea pacifica]MBN1009088.1 DEAD/DEAH box helicase family protein [Amphritea pacifica]